MRKRFRRLRPWPRRWRHRYQTAKSTKSRAKWQRGIIRPLTFMLGLLWALLKRLWRGFRWTTRSLWFRLMGAFAVVIILMLVILTGVIDSVTTRAFDQYFSSRLDDTRMVLPSLAERIGREEALIRISDNQIIIRPIPPLTPEIPSVRPLLNTDAAPTDPDLLDDEIVIDLSELDALTPNPQEAVGLTFLTEVRRATETAVIAAGAVSLVLGTLLFWQITRPLSRMRQAAQALAAGESDVRLPVRSRDELGKVATAFNQMASKLEQQEQIRRQMVADVAHELRTPLTVMNANLEAMLDGLIDPSPVELQELHDEVGRLTRMTDDLRLLSLADAGQLHLHVQKLPLAPLLTQVTHRLTPLAEARGVQLVLHAPDIPLFIRADGDRLQQALRNLLDNAIRHAASVVRITAVYDETAVLIAISDDGAGIAPDDLPHLFERFWRGDKSRTRHSGGSGLGLSIVKQIAEMHGGRVDVESRSENGTTFTMTLPLAS